MIRSKSKNVFAWMRRIVALVLALLMLGGVAVSAAEVEDVPYYSYCFWEGPSRYEAVPMRAMYEADTVISGNTLNTGVLNDAIHMCLSQDGKLLYILDSGNSRILVVDATNYNLIKEIGEIQSAEGAQNYAGAQGIYVDVNNKIYVCDTNNGRVMIVDQEGQLLHTITKPTDIGVPEDLDFKPMRLVMDKKGYLYLVSRGCYYGMLVYDTDYNFLNFHGSYKVEQSALNTIKGWIEDLFTTNENSQTAVKKLPAEIIDLSIDSDNMLYTLSDPTNNVGQIKRLGLNGNQTLNLKSGFQTQSGDVVNFLENPKTTWYKSTQFTISVSSIAVDPDGFVYVTDKKRGRIYMYDEECRMVCTFSGGFEQNDQVGIFRTAETIVAGKDKLFVLDRYSGGVTVFNLTEYGKLFKEADLLTIDGEYDVALPLWQQVMKLDANNQRAYEGIGKAMLNQAQNEDNHELYNEAMKYAKLGNDQQTYSQAFEVVQKEWMTNNFWWIFLLCIAAVGGLAALLVLSKKRKLFEIKNVKLKTALSVPIHPIQAFNSIKFQNNGSVLLAIIVIVLFYLASVSEDLYGGFMYVITDAASYNALFTLIGTVGVLLLWVISNWAICILNDGKGTLKEVFVMSAYSMTPMIVYSVLFTVASHLIPATSTSSFALLGTIMFIYTALLLLLGMTVVHEYTFFKAMAMAVMTILGMLLAAFVVFSVILLTQQFFNFFISIYNELQIR